MPSNSHLDEHTAPADMPEGTAAMVAHLAQQAAAPWQLEDGELYAVVNDGRLELLPTPKFTEASEVVPRRVERHVTVYDVPSLIAYLGATTDGEDGKPGFGSLYNEGLLEVWAGPEYIVAIIDGGDGWRRHRATLPITHSPEWREWAAINGKMLRQEELAQFVEDHLSNIAEPDGAALLDICQTLQAKTDVAFKSQTVLANSQRQFRYEETIDAKAGKKGNLTIPTELVLALRPYEGTEPVAVRARFRFQLRDGRLSLGVRLVEPGRVLEAAFDQVVAQVQADLPAPILRGEC